MILSIPVRHLNLFPARLSPAALDRVKVLALLAMLTDHINTLFIIPHSPLMYALGRVAFPLFTLIWAMNVHGSPGRLQHRANRLWMWAMVTQPAFMLAFRHQLPVYALNILFVFAGVTQLLALHHRYGRKGLLTGLLLLAVMVIPLTPGSFGMPGLMLACSLAVASAPVSPGWRRSAGFLAVISLVCLNGISHLIALPVETLLFATLPTLFLPVLAIRVVQQYAEDDGRRFMPRHFFYIAYSGHLTAVAVVLVFIR